MISAKYNSATCLPRSAGTGGHAAGGLDIRSQSYGTMREAPGPQDWREGLREQRERGADFRYICDVAGGYYGSTSRRFTFSKEDDLYLLERMREAGIKMRIGTDPAGR
jgi:hypothetical protein